MTHQATGLRAWREANGLSVREIAALTDVSASEISRAERGLLDLPALKKVRIARALGLSLEGLFSSEETPDGQ